MKTKRKLESTNFNEVSAEFLGSLVKISRNNSAACLWSIILFWVSTSIGVVVASGSQVHPTRWMEPALPEGAFFLPVHEPSGLAWDGEEGLFWVADRARSKILGIDPKSRDGKGMARVARTIDLSGAKGTALTQIASSSDVNEPYLWIVDQATWSIWLINSATEQRILSVRLPPTGLSRDVEITGISIDPFHGLIWFCYSAGHCSKLLGIKTPDPPSGHSQTEIDAEVEVSVFPRSDPRGLAWIADPRNKGGCLWSLAFNGGILPARQTLRSVCETGRKSRLNSIVDSMVILDVVPWRNPTSLAVKGETLWGAFDADPVTGRGPAVLPIREITVFCQCD